VFHIQHAPCRNLDLAAYLPLKSDVDFEISVLFLLDYHVVIRTGRWNLTVVPHVSLNAPGGYQVSRVRLCRAHSPSHASWMFSCFSAQDDEPLMRCSVCRACENWVGLSERNVWQKRFSMSTVGRFSYPPDCAAIGAELAIWT
jgi:hypothetical protein